MYHPISNSYSVSLRYLGDDFPGSCDLDFKSYIMLLFYTLGDINSMLTFGLRVPIKTACTIPNGSPFLSSYVATCTSALIRCTTL